MTKTIEQPFCPSSRVCDMTRDHLAHSEAELLERVADLEVDREALRVTLPEAIHALAYATAERDGLRQQNRAVTRPGARVGGTRA